MAAIAVGVAALVAINSFTANLRDSVRREARALLGADLSVSAAGPFSEKAEGLVAELLAATRPAAELARTVRLGAMAYRPGGTTTRLTQLLAVDPGYPYYGTIETDPAGEWERLGATGGAIVDASLLTMLGAAVGDEIALGEARFVVRAIVVNVPGDVALRSALGPRVYIPRSRVAETRLLTRGSRARYEAYLRFPPGADPQKLADRFRPALSAERLAVRTVSEDQRQLTETLTDFGNFLGLIALVALLLGGLGVASAVHVFIKRRMTTIAVLRCLGASSGTLLRAYLAQAVFVGLARQPAGGAPRRRSSARAAPLAPRRAAGGRGRVALVARGRRRCRGRSLGGARLLRCSRSWACAACRRSACCGATSSRSARVATRRGSRPCSRSRRASSRWRSSRRAG